MFLASNLPTGDLSNCLLSIVVIHSSLGRSGIIGMSMIFRKDVDEGVMVATGSLLLSEAGKRCRMCFKTNAVSAEVGVAVVSKNNPSKNVCADKISSLDLRSMRINQLNPKMRSGPKSVALIIDPASGVRYMPL
jgi:hypothetical protein